MTDQRVALVTGVSSGIGQATAQLLAQRGFTVFGTSRHPAGAEKMPGIDLLPLDVCAEESVRACVGTVVSRADRLDVLINNAGYSLRGAVEEISLEEAKAQFETNFFGVARMVKAVLPIMRRRGGGHIVNISSLIGLVPLPLGGFYAASKFALEGYTEALRHEVKPFNIRVSLVEPGLIKTRLMENSRFPAQPIPDYDQLRQQLLPVRLQYEGRAAEPVLVAERILGIIESRSPRLRNLVGKEARVARLRRFLPEPLFERSMRRRLHLDVK
jgi:NAD(P)-dependent dehydrogenase (short-subunit alcohol dehydrogenase family)